MSLTDISVALEGILERPTKTEKAVYLSSGLKKKKSVITS